MKIGIAYLEYSRRKGIERISAELADRIAQRGHEVHFHCRTWLDADSSKVRFHKVPTIDVANSATLLTFSTNAKKSLIQNNYNVTHSYGGVAGCDVVTAQSCHLAGMEIAKSFIKHDMQIGMNFGITDRIRLSLERRNFGKRQYKKVITCSSLVKRELIKYYDVPVDDIVVIPNGVDTDEFHPSNRNKFREQICSKYHINPSDIILLFVGHEFQRKGLEVIIRSLPLVNDKRIKLLICGGDKSQKFQLLANSLGLKEQIVFTGAQSDTKQFYAAADVFVFPTLHEAFGLVVTEAMACGLPVIVSKSAGAAEDIIEDGKDGVLLVDPQNAEELAKNISTLIHDNVRRQTLGANARAKALNYTWDVAAEHVMNVYEDVIGK